MSSLVRNIQKTQVLKRTENDALALKSAGNALLDLFATAGALRNRSDEDIVSMFAKAMIEDPLLATRLAFYTRDVRGGLGERRSARLMLAHLAERYPDILAKNIGHIAEFGRYDDLVYLLDIVPELVVPEIARQLAADVDNMKAGKPISLLGKWLPSVNTSNKETVARAKKLARALKLSDRDYRKTLSLLRKYLNVTEVNVSAKTYGNIVYPEVPSLAMKKYRAAFGRNDKERFAGFLENVKSGKEKINSSTLFPYDITMEYLYRRESPDQVLEEQWKALPNYVEGNEKFLVMADVSGSMYGRPMATSVGLALYFAERNKGPFANTFMTFSAAPELVTIKGETVYDKLRYIMSSDWGMNTDLEAAFSLLLYTAVKYNTPAEDMPDSIVVITDMEIDQCSDPGKLFYGQWKEKFEAAGYKVPNIVFWNVDARQNTFHASFDYEGVQLASGQSASVFGSLVKGLCLTPYEYMLSVLNDERYECITV